MKILRTIEEKKPEQDIYELPGEVNRYGVKILFDGQQWVIDAKTGKPVKRDECECLQGNGGLFLWVKRGEKIRSLDTPYPSVWEKPTNGENK